MYIHRQHRTLDILIAVKWMRMHEDLKLKMFLYSVLVRIAGGWKITELLLSSFCKTARHLNSLALLLYSLPPKFFHFIILLWHWIYVCTFY